MEPRTTDNPSGAAPSRMKPGRRQCPWIRVELQTTDKMMVTLATGAHEARNEEALQIPRPDGAENHRQPEWRGTEPDGI